MPGWPRRPVRTGSSRRTTTRCTRMDTAFGSPSRRPAQPWRALTDAGHFDGVLTVVLKLLGMVRPSRAYFGEKGLPAVRAHPRHVRGAVRRRGDRTLPHGARRGWSRVEPRETQLLSPTAREQAADVPEAADERGYQRRTWFGSSKRRAFSSTTWSTRTAAGSRQCTWTECA